MSEEVLALVVRARDEVSAEVAKMRKALHGLGASAASIGTGGLRIARTAIVDLAKVAAGVAVGGFAALAGAVTLGTKALTEQAKIDAQTAAVLKSTGGAAKVTAADVGKLADQIKAYSGIDDEAVRSGANMLLTFTNIRNETGKGRDIFTQATKTLADMSTAMGTDMKSSAIQLGKALNDPIGGLTALTRVGVTFTEQQKKQIETLVKHNDVAGAQKVILAELAKEFGGSAKAMGDSAAGAQAKVANAFQDMTKALAESVLPLVSGAMQAIAAALNSPEFQSGAKAIGQAIADIATRVTDWFERNKPLIEQLQGVLGQALEAIRDAVDRVIGIIGEVVHQVAIWVDHNHPLITQLRDQFIGTLRDVATNIGAVIGKIADWFAQNQPLVTQVRMITTDVIVKFIDGLRAVIRVFTDFGPLPALVAGVTVAVLALNAAVRANPIVAIVALAVTAIGVLVDAWDHGFWGMRQTIEGFAQMLTKIIDAIVRTIIEPFVSAVQSNFGAISGVINGVIGAIQTVIGLAQQAAGLVGGLFGGSQPKPSGPTHRASGGPVAAGSPYLVGEAGPELFVPRSSGSIVPSGGFGGAPVVIELTLDGRVVAEVVDRHLAYRYATAARTAAVGV